MLKAGARVVGALVGARVGAVGAVGAVDPVGVFVGAAVGAAVNAVGAAVGVAVGDVGIPVGTAVGAAVGVVGLPVGAGVGAVGAVGTIVGAGVGHGLQLHTLAPSVKLPTEHPQSAKESASMVPYAGVIRADVNRVLPLNARAPIVIPPCP